MIFLILKPYSKNITIIVLFKYLSKCPIVKKYAVSFEGLCCLVVLLKFCFAVPKAKMAALVVMLSDPQSKHTDRML